MLPQDVELLDLFVLSSQFFLAAEWESQAEVRLVPNPLGLTM